MEVTGKAEAVFEATRIIMEAVSKNSFSIGVTISLNEETFVNGWFWKIVGQVYLFLQKSSLAASIYCLYSR